MINPSTLIAILVSTFVLTNAESEDWNVHEYNLVSGERQLHSKAVWVAGRKVKDWQTCQAMCSANASCREFDYAASWNHPEYGYVEATGCGAAGTCYFRNDDHWPGPAGTGCNHTAGRRPGLPPPPGPQPAPAPGPHPPPPTPHPPLGYQPNIIFILTDDQDTRLDGRKDAYSAIGSMAAQASLQKHFLEGGVSMANGFVATPICCPSRTETFTGRHLHNVLGGTNCMHANTNLAAGRETGLFGRLTDQGYVTGLFGKVTNDQSHVLPLISKEGSASFIDSPVDYNNYEGRPYFHLLPNGTTYTEQLDSQHPRYGTTYQTTQIGNRSIEWIRSVAGGPRPFFAYLGPHAPHYPATPAPWYTDAFPDIKIPRTPNYNVSSPDKTQHIRQNPPLTALAECWENQHFRDRWQSLLSVDDIVEDLFAVLEELGVANKTFVIYSSDHGYKQGQWRVGTSKQHPYETDIHVPLLFKGPGVPKGQVLPHMSGNIDIMPTILDLAGGPGVIPHFVDGKSLLPVLVPEVARARGFRASEWRDYWLAEYWSVGTYFNDHSNCFGKPECAHGEGMPRGPTGRVKKCEERNATGSGECYFVDSTLSNSWRNMRIKNEHEDIAYIEYSQGFGGDDHTWPTTDATGAGLQFYELYDVASDPYQMTNLYPSTNASERTRLHALMVKYYNCRGNKTSPSTCT